MRGLFALAGAAALIGTAFGQADSSKYVDPETNFTFSQFVNDKGIAFRIAIPPDAKVNDNYEAVVQIVSPIDLGWVGLAWGGSMTYNPLTIVWVNGNDVVLSSRMAFGYYVPPAYTDATYTVLKKGTHVNATHFQVTATCVGCTLWGDSDTGVTSLDPTTQNPLAFAYAAANVTTPSSNTSAFSIHDLIGHWIHDFPTALNTDFNATVEKNA
ncbi:Cellobiose dehydrogenase, cytochrome [Niveomyces insectorum RCEF 264]|uniref:Cellobiose dehydrogenase, cytochrome n=1 Tax=Niveomyces insectorum RCEF 264 TaxID=1081102 RepID=A0A167XZU3_9HYPO|nr:Cellobiose dehydrogenase, cytochrome [Niveomyces insectorum RCEF 264]